MAATRSLGFVVLSIFYAFLFLFMVRGPIQNKSKNVLHRPISFLRTKGRKTVFYL